MPQKHDIGFQKRAKNELAVKLRNDARANRAERNKLRKQKQETPAWVEPMIYTNNK
ncbi:hypothetical protein [Nesterenkonia sp. CF4.4]|uniref:hypothetical protein n=1 Tax=Nesterenkonia sp. CF4.4 TaxID=3373079 RepID=UPI003EE465E5